MIKHVRVLAFVFFASFVVMGFAGCAAPMRHRYQVSMMAPTESGVLFTQAYGIASRRPIGPEERMGALLSLTSRPAPATPRPNRLQLPARRRALAIDPS